VNCQILKDHASFATPTEMTTLSGKAELQDWWFSPRTRGNNSADLLWKPLVSRRSMVISALQSWL